VGWGAGGKRREKTKGVGGNTPKVGEAGGFQLFCTNKGKKKTRPNSR